MMIIKWPVKVGTAWTFHNKQKPLLFSLVRSQADGEARESGSGGTGRQEEQKRLNNLGLQIEMPLKVIRAALSFQSKICSHAVGGMKEPRKPSIHTSCNTWLRLSRFWQLGMAASACNLSAPRAQCSTSRHIVQPLVQPHK